MAYDAVLEVVDTKTAAGRPKNILKVCWGGADKITDSRPKVSEIEYNRGLFSITTISPSFAVSVRFLAENNTCKGSKR